MAANQVLLEQENEYSGVRLIWPQPLAQIFAEFIA